MGRAWLFGVLLITALLSVKFLPTGTPSRTGEATTLASAWNSAPAADRVAIERVPIGQRALGRNPLREQVDLSLPDPDPATWRLVRLQMIKANGYPLQIELLRPLDYLELIGAVPGGTIELDLAEMGARGPAKVLSIGPCPPIPPGRGAVITGRFVHELSPDDKLVDVHIDGLPDPIGCTPNHLFWSETRLNFIPAADLQPGEQLLTATLGPVQVASIAPRPWEQYVYNLEVHAEHVYQVGELGTLVHNRYANPRTRLPQTNGKWIAGTPGNGSWRSSNPAVNAITGGKPISFVNGRPVFTPWSRGQIKFKPGLLDGSKSDFDAVYDFIKESKKLRSRDAARSYLRDAGLTPHHLDNRTIQLIPSDLHGNVPHIGSASDLRGGF
jgi:hypothetical protein